MNIYRHTSLALAAVAAAAAIATGGAGIAAATGNGNSTALFSRSAPMCPPGVYPGCRDKATCVGVTHDNRCHHNSHHGDRMRAVKPGGQTAGA